MIITLTLDEINISDTDCCWRFAPETFAKFYENSGLNKKIILYKLLVNNREYSVECPMIRDKNLNNSVLVPAVKVPNRKYPVYVYFYTVVLYLSTTLSMRAVAAKIRNVFGLNTFSHSTLCRTLQKLSTIIEGLEILEINSREVCDNTCKFESRKKWDISRQEKYSKLLNLLSPVLSKSRLKEYSSLLNYKYFKQFGKFII